MMNLSATIITLNEENNIKKCIESITDLVDEIIVVDSGSTDKTFEIARRYKCKVFFRKFDNFANQKNYALSKASGKWILSIDADEIIPEVLGIEIKNAIKSDLLDGYLVPRRNYIFGGEIKHTGFSPDKHIWLFKKNRSNWVGDVHEEVVVDGKIGHLKYSKVHYAYDKISDFIKANKQYAHLKAVQLVDQGIKFSLIKMIFFSVKEFIVRFIYRKGFLDGWRGLILSLIVSDYHILVWWKIKELQIKR